MGIPCLVTEAMVYEDRVSIAEKLKPYRLDHTIARCIDGISRLQRKIDTAMPL